MIRIIACLFALVPVTVLAQQKSAPSFSVVAAAGIIAGESTAKPSFQGSAGLSFNRFFAGAGAGIDYYLYKSIPVFADLRMHLGPRQRTFLYAHGGYNFPKTGGDPENTFLKSDKFFGGFYMDAGAGYRIPLSGKHSILFSAGYTRKNIRNEKVFQSWCITGNCPDQVMDYRYRLGRIVTKLSWTFGRN